MNKEKKQKKQLLNVSRLTETYKAKEIEYVKEIQGLKRRFSEFEMIESRKEELESREKILEEEIELLEGENASLKDRLNTAEQKAGYHREEIDRWKKKVADALESEKRAQQERSEAVQRRATMEVNLCSVQDDLETNIEELERTKELEQKYFEESNFYRSRVEVAEEEKKRYEEQILRLNKEKDTLELENSRLNGHRNHSQKIEYVTNLKKENNSMREKLQKLTFELNKMSGCEKCRRHDS